MKLALINTQRDFDEWKTRHMAIGYGDSADDPKEYPCWARTVVSSWPCETEEAAYLYRADLERMLAEME